MPGTQRVGPEPDVGRAAVVVLLRSADPDGSRAARVFRQTFDSLYDGQHTGRYRWDQLTKTEKTHYGSLFEINFRRAFDDVIDEVTDEKSLLDYRVADLDIDCKYSQSMNGWMLPPECFEHLLLVATASDEKGVWSLGVVRASTANRRTTENRDAKTQLNQHGTRQIEWLHLHKALPPNILLSLDDVTIGRIFAPRNGQARVNELLRLVTSRRIGRNTIATLAQQDDYMARLRDNGHGARTVLRDEGYLIPGDYQVHQAVARALGQPVPEAGEVVSFQVVPALESDLPSVELDGRLWRVTRPGDIIREPAPRLPRTKKSVG